MGRGSGGACHKNSAGVLACGMAAVRGLHEMVDLGLLCSGGGLMWHAGALLILCSGGVGGRGLFF